MTKRAFDKIRDGLEDAIGIARGEADPASYRVHVPAEIDVKAIRRRLGMTQEQFAARFGFTVSAVREWEYRRRQPERSARVLLMVIANDPDAVQRALDAPPPLVAA